jgi:hypothetical protein
MKESNTIIKIHTKVEGDKFILYGMGKLSDDTTTLTKEQAMLLYVDLHKYIQKNSKR